MHTAWKARCKVKEVFPAIDSSLNDEVVFLVVTEIVHSTAAILIWDPSIAPTMFEKSEISWNVSMQCRVSAFMMGHFM